MRPDLTSLKKDKSTEFKNKEATAGWQGQFPVIKALTVPTGFPRNYQEQTAKQNVNAKQYTNKKETVTLLQSRSSHYPHS